MVTALILSGKVQDKRPSKYASAFLNVDSMMRNLFFLPREPRIRRRREPDVTPGTSSVFCGIVRDGCVGFGELSGTNEIMMRVVKDKHN